MVSQGAQELGVSGEGCGSGASQRRAEGRPGRTRTCWMCVSSYHLQKVEGERAEGWVMREETQRMPFVMF